MQKWVSICAVLALFAATVFGAEDREKELDRVKAAGTVLNEIMTAPDKGIPAEILASADCVAIVPSMLKGGFVFGANYGKGVATCRHGESWSAPAPIRIEGGSWGLQAGGQAVDLVMLVMNQKGMNQLLESKFKIGADVSGAAGPVGRHAEATTDWKMRSQVLTYSRARGVFAGISLNGAVLKQDEDDTRALYGKLIPSQQILSGSVPPPSGTQTFLAKVAEHFRQAEEIAGKADHDKSNAAAGGTAGTASGTRNSQTKEGATGASVAGNTQSNAGQSGTTTEQPESAAGTATNTAPSAPTTSADVKSSIEKAFRNTPALTSGNVNVDVTDTTVELSGTVPSDSDKQSARRVAEQNAGGRKIVDTNLTVK